MKKTIYLIALLLIISVGVAIYHYYNHIDKEILRVEVLNGSGINGLAKKTAEYLRDKNLDVIIISNAQYDTISHTVIIDRLKKNAVYAKYVANRIGCKNIISVIDSSLYVDVTVIIGKDYADY